jgi:hypothetical protein
MGYDGPQRRNVTDGRQKMAAGALQGPPRVMSAGRMGKAEFA